MAVGTDEIRKARALLQEKGLLNSVVPRDLVLASRELKRPLREALDAMIEAFSKNEGLD